jgi:hypothetical protein
MVTTKWPRASFLAGAIGWLLAGRSALAHGVAFGPADARSVFIIAKSENKNQVHYGVHLDAACNPIGLAPVFGYWRMLERRGDIEPILALEEPAYGLADGQTIERGLESATIRLKLRAFSNRPMAIVVKRVAGRCAAVALGKIAGIEARIVSVYVKLRWPFGIEYLLLRGFDAENRPLEEFVRQ